MPHVITDHAMLRYLERVCGMSIRDIKRKAVNMGYVITSDGHLLAFIRKNENVNVEALRNSIVTPELQAALAVGAKTIKIDGTMFILHDGHVITLYKQAHVQNRGSLRPVLKRGQFAGIKGKDRRVWEGEDLDA
jgi:hypothetical protein